MADDSLIWRHKQWLSEIQPVGLVVSPPALERFGLVLERLDSEAANRLRSHCGLDRDGLASHLLDLPAFAFDLLGWCPDELLGAPQAPPLPLRFQPFLEDLHLHLRPSYVLVDPDDADGDAALVIRCEPLGLALDRPSDPDDSSWQISPMNRFLRLLRETAQPVGLLCNGQLLRLIYAPKGESPGYMDFPVGELALTAGRDMLAALVMLLNRNQLVGRAPERRLTALMKESRKYQNEVSNLLAEQVQVALDALLHGFQTADANLLCERSGNTTDHVYGGLLTVMMRLVFILYAENQGLMPDDPIYTGSYALAGLFERLEADETHYPDTMDQRFGAWAQLLTLFRLIFRGGAHGTLVLTARSGQLFHPDSFPFLEGRIRHQAWSDGERLSPPAVPDATVLAVLRNLLVLGGERLSYRSLDVETIGSVYEAMMGFQIEVARYPSLALGKFSVVVDLVALLAEAPKKRKDYLKSQASLELSPKLTKAVAAACDQDQLVAALESRISKRRPHLIAPGGLYLQPGEERRKTGSHYTPRELTEPIVRHTLEPVLAALGPQPSPEQLLELKICDPAMGSGAFLVETCRFLGDRLVAAWDFHKTVVAVPPDEDRVIHARRLIAGRCLYGIDKNPFAASLAKLSLWLVTLAKEHPFTFLDHALKCGDTLLGLSQEQIRAFHWLEQKQAGPLHDLHGTLEIVSDKRRQIHQLGDSDDLAKQLLHRESEDRLDEPRLIADLILLAFFQHGKTKDREAARIIYKDKVQKYRYGQISRKQLEDLRQQLYHEPEPQRPFHIELEFPEVFDRPNPGFDAFVGNPPFCGGRKISSNFGNCYLAWLLHLHNGSHGNADLVSHFFRFLFSLLRESGTMGLVATNTIAEGDTRNTGLSWICMNGGGIFYANRRYKWPGAASVIVSIICLIKGATQIEKFLDNKKTTMISSFLLPNKINSDPFRLLANKNLSFIGVKIYGNGFTFDDTDKSGKSSPISLMHELIQKNSRNQEIIHPYMGGEEINTSPSHLSHRFVINFKDMNLSTAMTYEDLMSIVIEKVLPERLAQKRENYKKYWWRFGEAGPTLARKLLEHDMVIVASQTSKYHCFTFVSSEIIFSQKVAIVVLSSFAAFSILQSSFHERWAKQFGSSLKDDPVYTPSDCFETFPFPLNWREHPALEAAGKAYFEYRAQWMVDHDLGMTKTYNLFHDPEEADNPSIERLRALHREMDQAVLAAYGWDQQVTLAYAYLLDYEEDEDEGSKRKKPWRYRWTDEVRDQVLALLLELNQQRAEEERRGPASDQLKHQKKQADALLRQPLPVKDKDVNYDQLPLFGPKS